MKTWPPEQSLLSDSTDIRASRRAWQAKRSAQVKFRGFCLVVSDVLAISAAWKFAQFLNQFYSPLPGAFVWWTWLGFPSIVWLFVLATLALFAHCRLYSYLNAAKDYAKAAQLISYVFLGSLVISYFYDPHLDLLNCHYLGPSCS
jgi:hypothetical protein